MSDKNGYTHRQACRTGLAAETARLSGDKTGVSVKSRRIAGALITDAVISDSAAKRLGKPKGRYITIEGDPLDDTVVALLKRALEQFLPKRGVLLAAGLGNPDITCDSLGALTVRSILPKSGRQYRAAALETDVTARTGVETAHMVRAVAEEIRADCVIAVDALACADPTRIGKLVQITNAGIIPGSGASDRRTELSRRTVGIPAVAIGVPTAAELRSITNDPRHNGYLAAGTQTDITVRAWADAISHAVNMIIK